MPPDEPAVPPSPISPLPGHSDEPPKGVFAMGISILWGVLAFACGFEAVVNFNGWLATGSIQNVIIAAVDLVLCFALGLLAVILWQRREWLPQRAAESARAISVNPSVWVAVVLVMLIISAPPQLRQSASAPTAEEIAKAVVRELPPNKTTSPPQQAALQTAPALSNSLHDDAVKYLFVRDVKAALKQQQIPAPGCHIILVHYAIPYSENFAIDFKELFGTVLGWPVDDRIATTTLPRGLSIRSTEDEPSKSCAKYMDGRLRSRLTWRNGSMPVDLGWEKPAEMSEYLRKCDGCVEIGIGNPPEW